MHIQLTGRIASLKSDWIKGAAQITVRSNLNEVDQDSLDRLAELCAIEIGAHARLQAEEYPSAVDLDCWISSVKGDFASKTLSLVLSGHKSEITQPIENLLVEWNRMERDVSVEISNRQMSFSDLKLNGVAVDKVTLTHGDKTVELR